MARNPDNSMINPDPNHIVWPGKFLELPFRYASAAYTLATLYMLGAIALGTEVAIGSNNNIYVLMASVLALLGPEAVQSVSENSLVNRAYRSIFGRRTSPPEEQTAA